MSADAWRAVPGAYSEIPEVRQEQLRILRRRWHLTAGDTALQMQDDGDLYLLSAIPQPFQTIVRNALQAMEAELTQGEHR